MTVDYKPIANDGAANVVSQGAYLVLLGVGGALQHGYELGTAQSDQINKTLRQTSMVSAAVAQAIADLLNVDVLDDGDLASLTSKLKLAMTGSAWTTGDAKLTLKTVADSGWIMVNDGTIGSAASGATYANDNALALFTLLWNNVSNAWAPVVTGRGGSAATDWSANKKITLTKMLGRALAIAGAGAGLTARALGENLGEENHLLTSPEVPATALTLVDPTHVHFGGRDGGAPGAGPGWGATFVGSLSSQTNTSPSATGMSGSVAGGGGSHNNMPPEGFLNAMLKL